MTDALLVMAGAAVGAPLRWLTDQAVSTRFPSRFPWGTLCVNLVGSLALGVVLALASPSFALLLGTGFCGAFTTFSTFSFETVRLLDGNEQHDRRFAICNVAFSLVLGCGLAALGWQLGSAL